MRIISKTRDYYDSAFGFHADDTLIYSRKETEFRLTPDKPEFNLHYAAVKAMMDAVDLPALPSSYKIRYQIEYVYLGVAGKVWIMLKYQNEIYHNFKDIIADLKLMTQKRFNRADARDLKYFEEIEAKKPHRKWNGEVLLNSENFDTKNFGVKIPNEIFTALNSPILYFESNYYNQFSDTKFLTDANLTQFHFQRIWGAFKCHQELDMFLGGPMAQQKDPVPERTDDLIRDQHGFDKNSFRNVAPSTKKARRRANKARKRSR